jgi:hypothetical protein
MMYSISVFRLNSKLACHMDFHWYPLDVQRCRIHLESCKYAYSKKWQVGGFLPGTPVSSANKTNCHDIADILLKLALNSITRTP